MRFVPSEGCPEASLAEAMVALEAGPQALDLSYGGVVYQLEIQLKSCSVWLTPWSDHISDYIGKVVEEYEKRCADVLGVRFELQDVTFHEELWGVKVSPEPALVVDDARHYSYCARSGFKWEFKPLSWYEDPKIIQGAFTQNVYGLVQDLASNLAPQPTPDLLWIPNEVDLQIPQAKVTNLAIIVEQTDGRFRLHLRSKPSDSELNMLLWSWEDWQMAESLTPLEAHCATKYGEAGAAVSQFYRQQLEDPKQNKKCKACGGEISGLSGAYLQGAKAHPLCYVCTGFEPEQHLSDSKCVVVTWNAPLKSPPRYIAEPSHDDIIWNADAGSEPGFLGINNPHQQTFVDREMILDNPKLRALGPGVLLCPEEVAVFRREVAPPVWG